MAIYYKIEYLKDDNQPEDISVFIHMKYNVPIYQSKIDKEDYDVLPDDLKHPFLTGLFAIGGIVEVSCRAYRIWISRSPVFSWEETLGPIFNYLLFWYDEDTLIELQGSGITLGEVNERRDR